MPCPPPGDFPNPGIEPRSPALQVDSLPSEPPEKPFLYLIFNKSAEDTLVVQTVESACNAGDFPRDFSPWVNGLGRGGLEAGLPELCVLPGTRSFSDEESHGAA